jgi:protein-tyrosine phosphatase
MYFADIHFHALYGVDDGARDEAQMLAMVDHAYRDGTRLLCLTPHFHPGYFGDNAAKAEHAYQSLSRHAAEKWPDLRLCLGNELRYSPESPAWLSDGACRTLNGTGYVLVDFSQQETARGIAKGLYRLLSAGYTPILAHAERYASLNRKLLGEFAHDGVLVQINAGSLLGCFGLRQRWRSRAILQSDLAQLVCSDAHDLTGRSPTLSQAFRFIEKKYGSDYAEAVCYKNALALLESGQEEGDVIPYESDQ